MPNQRILVPCRIFFFFINLYCLLIYMVCGYVLYDVLYNAIYCMIFIILNFKYLTFKTLTLSAHCVRLKLLDGLALTSATLKPKICSCGRVPPRLLRKLR